MRRTNIKPEAAMALSSIFEFLHSPSKCVSIATDANLPHVVEILLTNIKDFPNVVEKVCGALYFLAHGYNNAGSMSSVMSPFVGQLVSALLATADRSDSNNFRLCAFAYETTSGFVRCNTIAETLNMIVCLLQEILKRLN
jgi:importin subunit beta-1